MSDMFFLDTNVLVYTFDRTAAAKRERAMGLVELALESGNGVISSQVVQEFLNVATRKFDVPMNTGDAVRFLHDVLAPMCEVFPSIELFQKALVVRETTGYSVYDSLVVAAAVQAGCGTLYSEDLQDGRRVDGLTIRNPFRS